MNRDDTSTVGPPDDERSKIRAFVASGGRVAGGAAGAAIGLIGGPVLAIAGGAAGQAIGDTLASAGVEFYDRVLGRRQGERAAGALAIATVEIDRRLVAGDTPRQDFVDGADDDESDAAEVLEGTLLAAANAYEQRKIEYIGRFYANLAFDPTVSPSFANLLLQMLDRVTYGQLRVMAVLGTAKYLDEIVRIGGQREAGMVRSNYDVIAEMDELSTMGLVGFSNSGRVLPPTAMWGGDGVSSWATAKLYQASLTVMGRRVHDLLGLAAMPKVECDAVLSGLRGES
jgi:hypothetical protein